MALPWIMGGIAVAKGIAGIASSGAQRGAKEKAGRTANQERVKSGKKQIRLQEEQISYQNQQAIESLNILINNTERYLDRQDENAAQNWWLGELDRRDAHEADVAAYNQSVEDLHTALEFNDISANIAFEEESNYMADFHTQLRYEALEAQYALDDNMSKIGFEAEKAKIDIHSAMNRGASEREMLKLQNKAERAESAHQAQQEEIKGMQSKGKIKASMAAGRSSRKAVQSVDASMGLAQSMRVDALLNKNSMFRNQIQASNDKLYYGKQLHGNTMDVLEESARIAKRDYGLNRDQAIDTLKSGLRDNETRMAKISAGKYSADLQAKSQVLNVPQPGRMDPPPYNAIRSEYQAVKPWTKKDKQKFFDDYMPELEDGNKIYGDAGGKPNPWMQAAGIGLDAVGAYAGAGGFGGGGDGDAGTGDANWQDAFS